MAGEEKKGARRRKSKSLTTRTAIERVPDLQPWMKAYGLWIAAQPDAELATLPGEGRKRTHAVPVTERQIRATQLAGGKNIDRDKINRLERRPDFREFFQKVRTDLHFAAKARVQQGLMEQFDAREAGLRKAADQKVDEETGAVTYGDDIDHVAVERYTRPAVELANPKKQDGGLSAAVVVINLPTGGRAAAMMGHVLDGQEMQAIETEVVEVKALGAGGDDR